jgi:flagellar motor switch protein FliM
MSTEAASPPPSDGRPEISGAELEALLDKDAAQAQAQAQAQSGAVRPYDLLASDRIVRARMPALDRLNERWVADFQRDLRELIRQPVDVTLKPVQLTPYGEWQAATPLPASLNVYTVKPWPRSALVAVDGKLLFALVDSYYGGGGRKAQPAAREKLTPTEERLNKIVVDLVVEHFRRAFAPVAALEFAHSQTETNATYLAVATSSEAVVVTRVEVLLKQAGGAVSLVIPLSSFDTVRDKLTEGLKTVTPETRQRWRQGLRAQLEHTQLDLATVFLETELKVSELLKLKPGDILPIEMPKTATLRAGSRALLRGKFGRSRGYNAVSIIEAVKPTPPTSEESNR